MAHGPGLAGGVVEVFRGHRVLDQVFLVGQHGGEARADLKALFGQLDGGLDELRPRQAAVCPVRLLQHAHRAWHADRAAADHAVVEGHGLAVGADEQLFGGGGGRGLAAVPGHQLAPAAVQQKGAAADAAGLRFDQAQHHLHRHRRVDGVAARLQHLVAGVGGQRVGGGDGEFFGGPAGLVGPARSALGRDRRGRRRRVAEVAAAGATGQQGGGGQGTEGEQAGRGHGHGASPLVIEKEVHPNPVGHLRPEILASRTGRQRLLDRRGQLYK